MAGKLPIHQAQVYMPDTCVCCDNVLDVYKYCNDCQEALCHKCKKTHQCPRRNDDVVPMKPPNKHGNAILPDIYKAHPGKRCSLFCTECNVAICSLCFTQKHTHHAFKHFEDEFDSEKQLMLGQLKTLKDKLDHFHKKISERHDASITFKESVNITRKDIQARGSKLKSEVNSIVSSVLSELSSLVDQEEKLLEQDCERDEKNVNEIKQLIREVEQQSQRLFGKALSELTGRLRTTIPLYDETRKCVLPLPLSFESGQLSTEQLRTMIGYVQVRCKRELLFKYEKKEVNSRFVQTFSTFQVPQHSLIVSICPTDDTHAWVSVSESKDLVQVDKKGNVSHSVKLDFEPRGLALTNTTELLITHLGSSLIHKLSEDRRVTTFADISPLNAWDISVSDSDEVFVSTGTAKILVMNVSGDTIRQIFCGQDGSSIACLNGGNIAVATGNYYCEVLKVINITGQIIQTWSGELESGQRMPPPEQCTIASDIYDRVFVPDHDSSQVYVISVGKERNVKRLLLNWKLAVRGLMAVSVDRCGHVWIGCSDGTVHVIQL